MLPQNVVYLMPWRQKLGHDERVLPYGYPFIEDMVDGRMIINRSQKESQAGGVFKESEQGINALWARNAKE